MVITAVLAGRLAVPDVVDWRRLTVGAHAVQLLYVHGRRVVISANSERFMQFEALQFAWQVFLEIVH